MDNFTYDRPRFRFYFRGWMRLLVAVFLFSAVSTIHIFLSGPVVSALGLKAPIAAWQPSEMMESTPMFGPAFADGTVTDETVTDGTVTDSSPTDSDGPAAATAAGDDETEKTAVDREKEQALAIIGVEARIPDDVRKPIGMTLEELQQLTDRTIVEGEAFLAEFPVSEYRTAVITVLCRLYLLNSNRTFIDSTRLYKERNGKDPESSWIQVLRRNYFARIQAHLKEAISAIPEGEAINCRLVRLKADSFWHSQQYAKAIGQYRILIDQCGSLEDLDVVRCALLNSQLRDHDHSGAVSTADSFLAHHLESELLPHVLHLRGKALLEAGRLLDALHWWRSVEDVIHSAAEGRPVVLGGKPVKLSVKTRGDFQRYHEEINFTLGFIEFAMGDYLAAEQSFREEQELLITRQGENRITNVGQVYINRTERVYDTLVRLVGKPAPSLDLGDGWISNVSLDPIQEQGNVVLLLFAPYNNARYRDTINNLQQLYVTHWHEGLRVGWVAIPKGRNDLSGQLDSLTVEAGSMGLAFPVGMEMDKGYGNYKAYNAAVGGGTLVAIDRAGNLSWYKMDPTFRDESIISIVARRLLESDSGSK